MKKLNIFRLALLFCAPLIISCEADDAQGPEDFYDQGNFTVVLDAQKSPGQGQYRQVLQSNETLEIEVHVESPESLQSLVITKTVNLEPDASFGNGGTLEVPASGTSFDYTFTYEPSVSDVDQLVGFSFQAVAQGGGTATSDLTATVTLSPIDNLSTKRWGWSSIKHVNSPNMPNEEVITECEADNSFLFNADGTMSQDFGAITAVGNCGLDGLILYDKWYITEDGENFVMEKYNVFTPDIKQIESYRIVELSVDKLQLELTVDLSVFGLGLEVFLYTFVPEPIN